MNATIRINTRDGDRLDLLVLPEGSQDADAILSAMHGVAQAAYERGRADEEEAIQSAMRESMAVLRRLRRGTSRCPR